MKVINKLCKYVRMTKMIKKLVKEGLSTDGELHKQWYLERIAAIVSIKETWIDTHSSPGRGIVP